MMPGRICENPGCKNKVVALGYCMTHYRRIKRGGDPDALNTRYAGSVRGVSTRVHTKIIDDLKHEAAALDRTLYVHVSELVRAWVKDGGRFVDEPIPREFTVNLEPLVAPSLEPEQLRLLETRAAAYGLSTYMYLARFFEYRYFAKLRSPATA